MSLRAVIGFNSVNVVTTGFVWTASPPLRQQIRPSITEFAMPLRLSVTESVLPLRSFVPVPVRNSKNRVEALFVLLKSGNMTLQALVTKELNLYLTTLDDGIRSRCIILLAELVAKSKDERLSDSQVHTLIRFFTDRPDDWRVLRGALLECLALMRRKIGSVVKDDDAKALAKAFMQSVQVQSLAQHDRKLSFELLNCLLDRYPNVVSMLVIIAASDSILLIGVVAFVLLKNSVRMHRMNRE